MSLPTLWWGKKPNSNDNSEGINPTDEEQPQEPDTQSIAPQPQSPTKISIETASRGELIIFLKSLDVQRKQFGQKYNDLSEKYNKMIKERKKEIEEITQIRYTLTKFSLPTNASDLDVQLLKQNQKFESLQSQIETLKTLNEDLNNTIIFMKSRRAVIEPPPTPVPLNLQFSILNTSSSQSEKQKQPPNDINTEKNQYVEQRKQPSKESDQTSIVTPQLESKLEINSGNSNMNSSTELQAVNNQDVQKAETTTNNIKTGNLQVDGDDSTTSLTISKTSWSDEKKVVINAPSLPPIMPFPSFLLKKPTESQTNNNDNQPKENTDASKPSPPPPPSTSPELIDFSGFESSMNSNNNNVNNNNNDNDNMSSSERQLVEEMAKLKEEIVKKDKEITNLNELIFVYNEMQRKRDEEWVNKKTSLTLASEKLNKQRNTLKIAKEELTKKLEEFQAKQSHYEYLLSLFQSQQSSSPSTTVKNNNSEVKKDNDNNNNNINHGDDEKVDVVVIDREKEEIAAKILERDNRIAELEKKVAEMKDAALRLEEFFRSSESALQLQISSLGKEKEELGENLKTIKSEFKEYKIMAQSLFKQKDNNQPDYSQSLTEELELVKQQLVEKDLSISQLTSKVETLTEANAGYATYEENIKEYQTHIDNYETQITQLQKDLQEKESLKKDFEDLSKQHNELTILFENRVKDLQHEFKAEKKILLKEYSDAVSNLRNQIEQQNLIIERSNSQILILRSELHNFLNSKNKTISSSNNSNNNAIKQKIQYSELENSNNNNNGYVSNYAEVLVPHSPSQPSSKSETKKGEDNKYILYEEVKSKQEGEIQNLRKENESLEAVIKAKSSEIEELNKNLGLLFSQNEKLKDEIRNLELTISRAENVSSNSEYLKNILVQYMITADRVKLYPVIATILKFTPADHQLVSQHNPQIAAIIKQNPKLSSLPPSSPPSSSPWNLFAL